MLGLLLARAGVDVLVLEKHADFLRDFRGDTIHPSTLEVIHELGILDDLLKLPHHKAPRMRAQFGDLALTVADFSSLPVQCPYIAFMPQWDFLSLLATHASCYPTFQLKMQAEVTGLLEEDGRVVGLRATTPDGPLEVRANLVIGADGRHSVVREKAGLQVEELGAPMDVLWFRLSGQTGDPGDPMGRFDAGRIFIMLNRGDYWQCGFVIPKGTLDQLRGKGLPAFRESVARLAPFAANRVGELQNWEPIKLLTVQVDRLLQWSRPGLLCIGDAAHAMSPIGGVGINLAIQDAVAAANLLTAPLRAGQVTTGDLRRVQHRREWPTRLRQRMQLFIQNAITTDSSQIDRDGRPSRACQMRCTMKQKAILAALLWNLALNGCALNPEVRTTADDNSSLIFGFYDMSEAPYELTCVRITQDERAGIAYRQSCMTTFVNGLFFIENAPAMKYHIPFFQAGGRLHMISSDRKDLIDVPARSLYFLGSFKYKVLYRDLGEIMQLTPEKYGLNPAKSPDEVAVLKMLLEKVQDPRWKQRIRERLAKRGG